MNEIKEKIKMKLIENKNLWVYDENIIIKDIYEKILKIDTYKASYEVLYQCNIVRLLNLLDNKTLIQKYYETSNLNKFFDDIRKIEKIKNNKEINDILSILEHIPNRGDIFSKEEIIILNIISMELQNIFNNYNIYLHSINKLSFEEQEKLINNITEYFLKLNN